MIRNLTSLLILIVTLAALSGCECGQGSFLLFGMGGDKDNATLCNVAYADGIETSTEHRIFVTSTTYTGNLGGLTGADAKCQALASAAGLTLTYKAVLSDQTTDVSSRLTIRGKVFSFRNHFPVRAVTRDGSLWGVFLQHSIDTKEDGEALPEDTSIKVWTGSDEDGTKDSTTQCTNWSSSSPIPNTSIGSPYSINNTWLNNGPANCNSSARVFCISQ